MVAVAVAVAIAVYVCESFSVKVKSVFKALRFRVEVAVTVFWLRLRLRYSTAFRALSPSANKSPMTLESTRCGEQFTTKHGFLAGTDISSAYGNRPDILGYIFSLKPVFREVCLKKMILNNYPRELRK